MNDRQLALALQLAYLAQKSSIRLEQLVPALLARSLDSPAPLRRGPRAPRPRSECR